VSLLSWFEDKFAGELKAEYGPLSADAQGLLVSASLRQKPSGQYYLVFKWEGKSTLRWVDFEVTPVFLERMGAVLKDVTTRLGTA
jgi:hypothetical protein